MTAIYLETAIDAPAQVCFDLSRSIELHQQSTGRTRERAVAGRVRGLIANGETVTWEAVHFGVRQRLTVAITEMRPPESFTDEMRAGAFASMRHVHRFVEADGRTVMTDDFRFAAPLGFLGIVAEKLVLKHYMTRFLRERNAVIKRVAESGEWKTILPAC